MKRKNFWFAFVIIASFMFSSCIGLPIVGGVAYGYGTRHQGSDAPASAEPSKPNTGTNTNPDTGTTNRPATDTTTKPSTTTPSTGTNTSATNVVMEAWSNEYHYLFYKNGTVSIMDFNDKELSRPKYTSSSNTITINGEKFKFEDQSDNFESVPHKIGTLVKIESSKSTTTKTNNSNKNNDRNPNNRNSGRNRN